MYKTIHNQNLDHNVINDNLEKGHCMTETGRYSHNKNTTRAVVWLFILFYLLLLMITMLFYRN